MKTNDEPVIVAVEPEMSVDEWDTCDTENIIDLIAASMDKERRIEGVLVGMLTGIGSRGDFLVDHPLNRSGKPVPARAMTALEASHIGRGVALMFEGGEPDRPVIMGLMHLLHPQSEFPEGKKDMEISADRELTFRCGRSSIRMKKDGTIEIKGRNILSRASRSNDIKGGMINLN